MGSISDYVVIENLYYSKRHMWVRVEGDIAIVGVDDFTQKAAGDIGFVELPEENLEVKIDEAIGTIESGKWMGKLYAPISGVVIEINERIEEEPFLINNDPYGEGWLFKMKFSNASELEQLMKGNSEDFKKWLQEEIDKHIK